MYCPYCNAIVTDDHVFCPVCGTPLQAAPLQEIASANLTHITSDFVPTDTVEEIVPTNITPVSSGFAPAEPPEDSTAIPAATPLEQSPPVERTLLTPFAATEELSQDEPLASPSTDSPTHTIMMPPAPP